mmetsp:Transcript_99579/g.157608  ORF Transcript_99579/g.157608 Transcript_99579/m.157608 type:complete len:481 (+) Transcript_99579:64-1506(+)|eukprot:CAMPEP_0169132268 /NCGR_PEP_ID=MMETSP1015-20121227/38697_1 /TAXON_ID=342587 /ORGANISM="Karlodinium micrum, Strain CCMP2283" /LENGTH=480 /DNA_ID=CAMNT_0009196599 /DNA_START=45 /DNA_END=1487 /DNA_ORIENTATION=-
MSSSPYEEVSSSEKEYGDPKCQTPMSGMELGMRNNASFPESCGMSSAFTVINGVLLFHRLPADARFREIGEAMMTSHLRMGAIPHDDGSWEPVAPADVDWSYLIVREPAVRSQSAFSATIDSIGAQPLDLSQPPWRIHVIPSSDSSQLPAVLIRIHHCVGDGVHLMQVLQTITRREDGTPPPNEALKKFEAMTSQGGCKRRVGMCCGALPGFVSALAASKKSLETDSTWNAPEEARRDADFSGERRVVIVPPHSLEFIKECKDLGGVSVNDIVQAATAGAIRRYCEKRGDPLFETGEAASVVFRALVPVAIPRKFPIDHDEKDKLTNNFCFCSAVLPVGAATAMERVSITNREMSKLKNSMQPIMALFIVDKLGPLLPSSMIQQTGADLFKCHGLVFSNVPGPSDILYCGGEKVVGCCPIFFNGIPQIIVCSYNGKMWMSLTVNPEVMTNHEWFAECYLDELREIGRELGVSADLAVGVY